MNLKQCLFTNNEAYKANTIRAVKGIMIHSTAANNPYLKRYVGPNDGLLGVNKYGNHWNVYHPGGKNIGPHTFTDKVKKGICDTCGGRQVCANAFIGKLADGTIATYQTLPWNIRGWHSGAGAKGNADAMGYIGVEICEDGLTDKTYFEKVYQEAVELCVYLCKKYNLTEKNIICHSEGHAQGIASNHGDVMHWFPKFGKNMNTFRAAVKAGLANNGKAEKIGYRVFDENDKQIGYFSVAENAVNMVRSQLTKGKGAKVQVVNKG